MDSRTVMAHAPMRVVHGVPMGTRARYTGTQSWGPATVTVIKPWGGLVEPLYVVVPDGMDSRFTYVVAESELSPVGVSLRKSDDRAGFDADVELCAPYGDGSAPAMRVNLARTSCDWCEGAVPALYNAFSVSSGGAWVERFCGHHAFRFGSFRPVGFVESV